MMLPLSLDLLIKNCYLCFQYISVHTFLIFTKNEWKRKKKQITFLHVELEHSDCSVENNCRESRVKKKRIPFGSPVVIQTCFHSNSDKDGRSKSGWRWSDSGHKSKAEPQDMVVSLKGQGVTRRDPENSGLYTGRMELPPTKMKRHMEEEVLRRRWVVQVVMCYIWGIYQIFQQDIE